MFNSIFIAKVSELKVGTTLKSGHIVEADKNGNAPVILQVIAGKCPNKMIVSGTVFLGWGISAGNTYAFQCRETESSEEYGRQFNYTPLKEVSFTEILEGVNSLGQGVVFDAVAAEVTAEEQLPR